MSHTHIQIFRLRLEIFHTLAYFHTLVWEKSYKSMEYNTVWKISEDFPLDPLHKMIVCTVKID